MTCTLCPLHLSCKTVCVSGEGDTPCDVMIVGEAPGHEEDEHGRPFIGKSGQLLRDALEAAGLNDFYITNMVNCRPPDNRTPNKKEIKACQHWFQQRLEECQPKYILLLGKIAFETFTGLAGITKHRSQKIEHNGFTAFATMHPAFILRFPEQENAWRADIRQFAGLVQEKGQQLTNPIIVDTPKLFDRMLDDFEEEPYISYDHETTSLYPWKGKVVSWGFGTAAAQYCIPDHFMRRDRLQVIKESIENSIKITHTGKFDDLWGVVHHGVQLGLDFDLLIASYMANENKRNRSLKAMGPEYLGVNNWDVSIDTKTGAASFEKLVEYQAYDLTYTRQLYWPLRKEVAKDSQTYKLFKLIMMPLLNLFVKIEAEGFVIDYRRFKEVEVELTHRIARCEAKLKAIADINWGSPQQVAAVLFDDMGIEPLNKTKSGRDSTAETVMNQLALDYPIARDIVEYRGHKQQKSFFIDGWKPYLVRNERIHSTFKLHGTVTGRPSCEHPNLQQVPRDPFIRSLIIAMPGWELVEFDLSQIEMRIAAELSGDPTLMHVFRSGGDVHWTTALREIMRGRGHVKLIEETASALEGRKVSYDEAYDILVKHGPDSAVDFNDAWAELRKKAKAVNFGYIFGMWWKKFRVYAFDNYGVILSDREARESREGFFDTYSSLEDWHKRQKNFARRNGYVRSLSGRMRRLPAAMQEFDSFDKKEAERQAINSPVQSFASELNLMAALEIAETYRWEDEVRIVGTVHDAILTMIPRPKVRMIAPEILKIMSHPKLMDVFNIRMSVPIEADAKVGPWGKGVKLKRWLVQNELTA